MRDFTNKAWREMGGGDRGGHRDTVLSSSIRAAEPASVRAWPGFPPSHILPSRQPSNCVWSGAALLLILAMAGTVSGYGGDGLGCVFHCITSTCGPPVEVINHPFAVGAAPGKAGALTYQNFQTVDLRSRDISSIASGGLDCWGGSSTSAFLLDNNPLGQLLPATVLPSSMAPLTLSMNNCSITVPILSTLELYLLRCSQLYLSNNQITSMPTLLQGARSSPITYLDLSQNNITCLQDGVFAGLGNQWETLTVNINLESNQIASVASNLFGYGSNDQHGISAGVALMLRNNRVDVSALDALLTSVGTFMGSQMIDVSINSITTLGPQLFAPATVRAVTRPRLLLNVSVNPLSSISNNVFGGTQQLAILGLDMSYPTNPKLQMPTSFNFTNISFPAVRSTLAVMARNMGANLADVARFNQFLLPLNCTINNGSCTGGCGPTCSLELDLSENHIPTLGSLTLASARVTSLTLTHTNLTLLAPDAFGFSTFLKELDLSNNALTVIPVDFQSNTPALSNLRLANNAILALPQANNHITQSTDVLGNPLQCQSYGPNLQNCACLNNDYLRVSCGYMTCVANLSVCPHGSIVNASDCSLAPWPVCVSDSAMHNREYYNENMRSFMPLTDCGTAYRSNKGHYLPAFAFSPATVTTDRMCSLCTTCPSGYVHTDCTATTNTICRANPAHFGFGAMVYIGMAIALVACVIGLVLSRRRYKRTFAYTVLESDVSSADSVRMSKFSNDEGWIEPLAVIGEMELDIGKVITNCQYPSGGPGNVHKGTWGNVSVAVRVFDPLNPRLVPAFNEAVALVQSVRHAHVVTFYGSGVLGTQSPYLVTEYLSRGSLQALLYDPSTGLDWATRLQFATDIASGMRFLHEMRKYHGTLSAESCFVDDSMRVKVGNFGLKNIGRAMDLANEALYKHDRQRQRNHRDRAVRSPAPQDVALLGSVGYEDEDDSLLLLPSTSQRSPQPPSRHPLNRRAALSETSVSGPEPQRLWMWMAPEALSEGSNHVKSTAAMDVFSFAIVLWEIWARSEPWLEVRERNDKRRWSEVKRRVIKGSRPTLPGSLQGGPAGFSELMEDCWQQSCDSRPTFDSIVSLIGGLQDGANGGYEV
eukprot:m.32043 g.32043  ORF g.32043 m.32043 type:complete len:1106 (-) comp4855_c0_seq1:61-3378(-)